ncbi:MAG TPA: patatin-like phospholipase family protein [Acidimicrobiales bacterium]
MRVGLVLGAGGVTGLAYHAAALAALEHDVGWDPRSADIVTGTSAGSVVAALLRRGIPAGDLSAIAVGDEPAHSPEAVIRALNDRQAFPPLRLHRIVGRVPRLPSRAIVEAWLRRPWRVDPVGAVASIIPDGTLDLVEHTSALDELLGSRWPDEELWICAVRQRDLRRIVLGRDMAAPLSPAVAASCAIPGYFRPVRIGADTFVDGGVRSPTNADVLRRSAVDLAIIVSPMSGRDLRRLSGVAVVRRHARNRLEGERRRLTAAGIPSLVVEPGPEVIEVLGTDFMSDTRAAAIVEAARADTAAQLGAPEARALVARLTATRRPGDAPGRRHRLRATVRRLRDRRRHRPIH